MLEQFAQSNQKTDIIVLHAVIVMCVFMFASCDFLEPHAAISCDSVQRILFNHILQLVMSPNTELTVPL